MDFLEKQSRSRDFSRREEGRLEPTSLENRFSVPWSGFYIHCKPFLKRNSLYILIEKALRFYRFRKICVKLELLMLGTSFRISHEQVWLEPSRIEDRIRRPISGTWMYLCLRSPLTSLYLTESFS
jgi:hypothetical protein